MSVSLRDVVLSVSYGDASLVGESAGYLILGAADIALRTCERGSLDSITIDEEGSVRLAGPPVEEYESELALRGLLATLLAKVRIPSNNLARVAGRRDLRGLRGLVAELEAALVPVNRRAARRTLARLCREAQKSAAREHAFAAVEEIPQPEPVLAVPLGPDSDSAAELLPAPEPVQNAPSPLPLVAAEASSPSRAEQATARYGRAEPAAATYGRAEHAVAYPRRVSQLPTIPARPDALLLERLADSYGAATPVEPVPVVQEEVPERVSALASASEGEPAFEEFTEEDEDELDNAKTQVFAGVMPILHGVIGADAPGSSAVDDGTAQDWVADDVMFAERPVAKRPVADPPVAEQLCAEESAVKLRSVVGRQLVVNAKMAHATPPSRRRPTPSQRPHRALSEEDSLIVMSESAPRRSTSDIGDLLDKMAVSATSTEDLYTGLKSLSRIDLSPVAPPVGAAWIDDERR